MIIDEYDQLAEAEKIKILLEKGRYVIHLQILEQLFMVFKLWRFYVEVCYDPATEAIYKLRTFSDRQGLSPYLDGFYSNKPA